MLQLNGMTLSDFKNHSEALKTADEIVQQNQHETGNNYAPIDHTNPLLVKVFYVHHQGKKRMHNQIETKSFHAQADVKNKKQLIDGQAFLEALGDGQAGGEGSSTGVKVENSNFLHMNKSKDALKPGT